MKAVISWITAEIQIYLREAGKLSLQDVIKRSEHYRETHNIHADEPLMNDKCKINRAKEMDSFIACNIWQNNTCSMIICSLAHEKLVSCAAEPTDTRTVAPLTPRHRPRMPCVLKIDLRAPAMPPVCSCWCPTAISSFAWAWRWVFTYNLFATILSILSWWEV